MMSKYYNNVMNCSFLRIVLPNNDIEARAEVAQRPNYLVRAYEFLPSHIEFELSRLLEKYYQHRILNLLCREIHYHIKVEIEKKTLER